MVVVVWRTRWKMVVASCRIRLPSLPAFPKIVIEKVSPRTPCVRSARVTPERNHLKSMRTIRGVARTRGTEKAAA